MRQWEGFWQAKMLEDDGFVDFSVLMHCAVYALVRRGVVVYVGKSKSVGERTQSHIRLRRKSGVKRTGMFANRMIAGIQFDEIWVRKCMLGELDELEIAMIKKYQPKYNQHHNPTSQRQVKAPPPIELAVLLKSVIAAAPSSEPPIRRRV